MVKIILRTLLSDDHFAVFGFNGDGIKLPNAKEDCFKHTFGLATPTNKKRMVEFVDSLSARGTTDYRGGIEKALKFFQTILPTNTATGTATKQVKKNKVFVLVSGTAPREKKRDLEDLVVTGHAQDPQNHIRVVTMGIGLKSKGKATSVMKKLIDKSSKQVGYFYNVESIERPVTQMRKILGHFTELDQNKTILSEVHSDFINKEPIVTIAQPVVHNGNLVGVVGTDITVAELFFFKKLLNRFEKSYLFVMRRQDNVVFYHPLLPHPALDGSSLVYQIELLEREADKQGILAQMEKDGIQQTKFDALYYWQSFFIGEKIKSAMFTICAVLFDGKDALITLKVPITGAPFTYHVTEKVTLAARHCKYFKRTAISDTTGLKFSTDAFNKPVSDYLSTKDSERDYARILKPRDPVDKKQTLLQDNVIESVEITNKADLEWIWNQKWLGVSYAVWRYIALVFGVFRCYPTVQMPKRFRPKDTEW
ncbi:hypothetical protein LSAT2_015315 [Lamellibrachia satsuma]|nr:hypothetical protein LSAT2_015315 [Lamellibrachia satsuma]